MINMGENFSQRANDNKDDKDVNLEVTKANNIFRDKDHVHPRNMKINAPRREKDLPPMKNMN